MNELSKLESTAVEWLPLICALVLKLIKMFKPWEAGYLARTCLCPQNRSGASSDSSYSPERDKRTAGMTVLSAVLRQGQESNAAALWRHDPAWGPKDPSLFLPPSLLWIGSLCSLLCPLVAGASLLHSQMSSVSLTCLNPLPALTSMRWHTHRKKRLGALVNFPKINSGRYETIIALNRLSDTQQWIYCPIPLTTCSVETIFSRKPQCSVPITFLNTS